MWRNWPPSLGMPGSGSPSVRWTNWYWPGLSANAPSALHDSCQFLAQTTHPYTPTKERRKALLERRCEGMQGGESHTDHPAVSPPDDARHRPDVPEQAH